MPTISHFYGIIIVMYLRNKEHVNGKYFSRKNGILFS